MTIEGDYTLFAHLETVYLGVLARRTLISTNTARVLRAANGKPIIFMPARHDHHRVQTGDGYAAYVAGAMLGSRDRRHLRRAGVVVGRPRRRHRAARADRGVRRRHRARGDEVRRLGARRPPHHRSRRLRERLGRDRAWLSRTRSARKLWGVRLDTSGQLVDRSLWDEMGDFDPRGVNERLVRKVRAALDGAGTRGVRIVASGGFSVEKIEEFERRGVPVDAYGVGSSLIRGENDFTADIVVTDGRPSAKVGRRLRPNPRLERVA